MKPAATVQRPIGFIADLSSRPRVTCICSCCPSSHPRALPSSLPDFSDQPLRTTSSDPEEPPAPSSTSCLQQLARGRYLVAAGQPHSALAASCAIPTLQPCSRQQRSTPYARTCVSLVFQWPRNNLIHLLAAYPGEQEKNLLSLPERPWSKSDGVPGGGVASSAPRRLLQRRPDRVDHAGNIAVYLARRHPQHPISLRLEPTIAARICAI